MEEKKIIELIERFIKKEKKLKSKIPYQFNLIDEFHIKENAHSRILTKILDFKENGKYPFLESFFRYLEQDFVNIKITKPEIEQETDRIDVQIKEKGKYAVIIENKINGATDRKEQLKRYYDIAKNDVQEKSIYVLYLTKDGGSPSIESNSFSAERRKTLNDRYKEINYKDDILPWLEQFVLPECKVKEPILISAVKQYIHYLKGLFLLREDEQHMYLELNKYIEEKFNISNENIYQAINAIKENILSIEKLNNQENEDYINIINYLRKLLMAQILLLHKSWFEELQNKYGKFTFASSLFDYDGKKIVDKKNPRDTYLYFGIKLNYQNSEFLCAIGFDNITKLPEYGLTIRDCTKNKLDNIKDWIDKNGLKSEIPTTSGRWYGHNQKNALEDVFTKFTNFYDKVLEKI